MHVARRMAVTMSTALAAMAVMTGSAVASSDQFMTNKGLSAYNAYASVSAHSGVTNVSTSASGVSCPALSQGWTGYTSVPNSYDGSHWMAYINCGYGAVGWNPSGTANYYFHGTAYNPGTGGYDQFAWAIYYW
jgi:hypothetical protein